MADAPRWQRAHLYAYLIYTSNDRYGPLTTNTCLGSRQMDDATAQADTYLLPPPPAYDPEPMPNTIRFTFVARC